MGHNSDDFEPYKSEVTETKENDLEQRLLKIEAALKSLSKRYSWEDKETASGIQLAGVTSITRTGFMLTSALAQVGQNQMAVVVIIQEDITGKLYTLPIDMLTQI